MGSPPASAPLALGRRTVLGLLFFATLINYLDRLAISIVAPALLKQFSFSSVDYSHIVFFFIFGYTLGQTAFGKLIDRLGTRTGLLLSVGLWSVAACLHSLAMGIFTFGLFRFFLGFTEGGNWPGAVKAVSEHFPPPRRAFAVGVFNSGSIVGAILAPPAIVAIERWWGWRPMFTIVGVSGFVWVAAWSHFYRRRATGNALLADSALQLRGSTFQHLRQRVVWGLMIGRFFSDPIWWFYAFWLPAYLAQSRGFDLLNIGKLAWIPYAAAGVGGLVGGHASGLLVKRGWTPVAARKAVMVTGAALMLAGLPAIWAESHAAALGWISVVLFGYASWASNMLSLPADLFPSSSVGEISGLSGTAAACGGMLLTLAVGRIVQRFSYAPVFALASMMITCAAVAVLLLVKQEGGSVPDDASVAMQPAAATREAARRAL
jgi:ACS family hexuronate transporter-like MFS transporter